jgi:predicted acyl esterase
LFRFRIATALCLALIPSRPLRGRSGRTPRRLPKLPSSKPSPASTLTPWNPTLRSASTSRTASSSLKASATFPPSSSPRSAVELTSPTQRPPSAFTLDAAGRGEQWSLSTDPEGAVYRRTGPPVHHLFHDYQRTEVMIPMRDGVKLHAVILKPADIAAPLPFLIQRTPTAWTRPTAPPSFQPPGAGPRRLHLRRRGHSRPLQERGRVRHDAAARRPHDPKAIDESTDAYDTVAWLLKNVPGNNGRAGFIGTSYPGFLAMMAGIDPHPAVKAISPRRP